MSSQSEVPILRPVPRRPFDLDTPSATPPGASTPETTSELQSPIDPSSGDVKRTKSSIALTSSTLFGIYDYTEPGAQTPTTVSRAPSVLNISDFDFTKKPTLPATLAPQTQMHKRARAQSLVTREKTIQKNSRTALAWHILRITSLFVLGTAYGIIVTHLHHSKSLSATSMLSVHYGLQYLITWGLAGIALGSILPWLDGTSAGAKIDWEPVVRSIGAFVGIAYAIRKLPWQSTLQVSLTLALINPFLWYLVDRTRAGFWFSAVVGVVGSVVMLQTSPGLIQAPEIVYGAGVESRGEGLLAGWVPVERVGVWVWVCSVLFCSCVCFGNVGRRLAGMEKRV